MQQKPRPVFSASSSKPVARRRPKKIVLPEADSFPGVGVTFQSYNHESTRPVKPRVAAKPSRWKRFFRVFTLRRSVVVVALLVLVIGGWLGGKFVYNAHKLFGGNIFNVLSTTKLSGEDSGRVNILLAGNSADDVGHDGADLTDSILVLSINTKDHNAFMLSIPRDLWVDVPDEGYSKINYAYVAGQTDKFSENGYPDGGMGLLEETIQQKLGLTINYYALIDYNAFKQAVDAVGGIDLNIQSTDKRGLYDPSIDYVTHGPLVKLTNGTHHLDGEAALDLARARGDNYRAYGFPQSDFDRTNHQRQMLVALKTKAVSAGVITNPSKLSSLSDAIGNNVKTDFNLSEVHRLYDLTKDINANSIASIGLNNANGKDLLANYTAADGEAALIPADGIDDYSDIQAFLKQITSSDPVVREGASLVVLNGAGTQGLASSVKASLTAKNYSVDAVGDALATQPTTTIIDTSGGKYPLTLQQLHKLYPKATVTTTNPYAAVYKTDIILVLGQDAIPATTGTAATAN